MWPTDGERTVTCIACGRDLKRSAAREYDKFGDRWDRAGKTFEYLCKPCFSALGKRRRADLEPTLERAGAGRVSDREFLARYLAAAEEQESER